MFKKDAAVNEAKSDPAKDVDDAAAQAEKPTHDNAELEHSDTNAGRKPATVPELPADEMETQNKIDPVTESVLRPLSEIEDDYKRGVSSFEMFVDERILVSHDAFGKKEMKIKVLEVSDELPPTRWKFGDRVKLDKILITIKHLESNKVEEGELDIAAVEKELTEKRHYTSTNRWVPVSDIKNGYVIGSRHTSLISDALALDYIVF